jgi:lysozyme
MFNKCLDVSHNNGPIKWSQVKAAGYRLAFIKATQGTKFVDPQFSKYMDGAKDVDILTVPYHFINIEPADLQAAHFINIAKLKAGSVCMLDWERNNDVLPQIRLVEALGENIRLQTGRDPVIYHGLYELSSKKINAWPWFVPKWGKQPAMKWLFWQDTAKQRVPGIVGDVDHDDFNGTEDELVSWYNNGTLPAGVR